MSTENLFPNAYAKKEDQSNYAKEFSKSNLKRNIDPDEIEDLQITDKEKENIREKLNAIFDIFNDPENWKIPLNFVRR